MGDNQEYLNQVDLSGDNHIEIEEEANRIRLSPSYIAPNPSSYQNQPEQLSDTKGVQKKSTLTK